MHYISIAMNPARPQDGGGLTAKSNVKGNAECKCSALLCFALFCLLYAALFCFALQCFALLCFTWKVPHVTESRYT